MAPYVLEKVAGTAAEVEQADWTRGAHGDHAQHDSVPLVCILGSWPIDPTVIIPVKRQAVFVMIDNALVAVNAL
jgi:hypothetical protein